MGKSIYRNLISGIVLYVSTASEITKPEIKTISADGFYVSKRSKKNSYVKQLRKIKL